MSTDSHFQWPAIFGGAAVAAGTSLTLNAFGAGIGLSVVSGISSWRESSAVAWMVAGAFLLFVAIISFAVGGYVAGFILSVVLTAASFGLVMGGVLSPHASLIALAALAFVQIVVHLVYFLHMNGSSGQRWNVMAFSYTVLTATNALAVPESDGSDSIPFNPELGKVIVAVGAITL